MSSKFYACFFVCMAMKANEIEVCSDLSSDSFLASSACFYISRGLPSDVMFADDGQNFVGTWVKSRSAFNPMNYDKANKLISSHSVRCHFSSAKAPYYGGLCEVGACSMTLVLSKIIGCHVLILPLTSTN